MSIPQRAPAAVQQIVEQRARAALGQVEEELALGDVAEAVRVGGVEDLIVAGRRDGRGGGPVDLQRGEHGALGQEAEVGQQRVGGEAGFAA